MENIDFTATLPDGVSVMLAAGGILLLSTVIVMIIIINQRWKGRVIPILLGAVSYLIFVFVCTNLITSALAMIPSIDVVFDNDPYTYNLIYNLIAVVAFTIARLLMANMCIGRYERKGDILLGGLGLGLGDAILYGITAISYYSCSIGLQSSSLEDLFVGMTEDQMTSAYSSIEALFVAPAFLWLLLGISCIFDVVLNIAMMNAVFGAVKGDSPKWMIWLTTGINFASLLSFQLYDQTSENSIIIWFVIKTMIFVVAMYYLFHIRGKEITYSED